MRKISDYVTPQEYNLIKLYAPENPELIVAIGIHETGWGTLGAGRQGYHLGYGVYNDYQRDYKYQGLENQLKYGSNQIKKFLGDAFINPLLEDIKNLGYNSWKPGSWVDGQYINTGNQWGESVYSIYSDLVNDYEPEAKSVSEISSYNSSGGSGYGGRTSVSTSGTNYGGRPALQKTPVLADYINPSGNLDIKGYLDSRPGRKIVESTTDKVKEVTGVSEFKETLFIPILKIIAYIVIVIFIFIAFIQVTDIDIPFRR